jgi:cytochrome c-type biogenesis protein CcmH
MRRGVLLLMALLWALPLRAAIDPYDFSSAAERQRYQHFIEEMRCPKCQNQNLAGSDAPIAADLRRELRKLLREGRSDDQITAYMVARYGEFILYDPPLNRKTLLLWAAPGIFLALGATALVLIARRRRPQMAGAALSAQERQRLDTALHDNSNGGEDGHS